VCTFDSTGAECDPELRGIMNAWHCLPANVKADLCGMIKAALQEAK
jgi:hypothetical protein